MRREVSPGICWVFRLGGQLYTMFLLLQLIIYQGSNGRILIENYLIRLVLLNRIRSSLGPCWYFVGRLFRDRALRALWRDVAWIHHCLVGSTDSPA